MSRYIEYDGDDDSVEATLRSWAWTNGLDRAMKGRRGLKVLQDMEAALLALPAPRLISNAIVKDGEFCAVGAFAQYKGVDLSKYDGMEDEDCDLDFTTELGMVAGMQKTLAWEMAYRNDEIYARHTPEVRFAHVLAWVRHAIASNPYYVSEEFSTC